MDYKAGDIIRPKIIGRGIRSYVVVATGWVRMWNVTTEIAYGATIRISYLPYKAGWTLAGHTKMICADNRDAERVNWTHRDWNHHP